MPYEAFSHLIERTGLKIGREVGQIPEFSHVKAAAHLGALRRNRLYGNPGTPEGRRLGGLTSIARQHTLAPSVPATNRFVLPKSIAEPGLSSALAEFMGMMLGDGCLNNAYQLALYFNAETDSAYADFLETCARKLFGLTPRRWRDPDGRGGALIFSSKRLVDYLLRLGFARGDKVVTQARVPNWVLADPEYRRSCLRGLMDTDGSIYDYQHRVYGRQYSHAALCFTNRSLPLLTFVAETLRLNGYRPVTSGFRIYLYRRNELIRYFSDIGTHNEKHRRRYERCMNSGIEASGRGTQVVDGAGPENR